MCGSACLCVRAHVWAYMCVCAHMCGCEGSKGYETERAPHHEREYRDLKEWRVDEANKPYVNGEETTEEGK